MDTFSGYHPIINFLYYLMVIGISMLYMHPVFLGTALAAALSYAIYLKGRNALKSLLMKPLLICLLTAALNPLFNHEGATMLFYLKNGNPITLESIVYGIGAGTMLSTTLMWFSSFHIIITADKLTYLFGKTVTAFSLLLSMALRFVPKFSEQMKKVAQAQQCIGRNVNNGKLHEKVGHGVKILSITTTWALENSVETADSMKSRAYGLRGRSNFSIYRFDQRDFGLLVFLFFMFVGILYAMGKNWVHILYFPVFTMNQATGFAFLVYFEYAALCFLPLLLNMKEDIKWHYLRSKI